MKTVARVSAILFLSLSWTLYAEENDGGSSWLALQATISPSTYVQGAEITVAVKFTNASCQTQTLQFPVGTLLRCIRLSLRNNDGKVIGYGVKWSGCGDAMQSVCLAPGETIEKLLDLSRLYYVVLPPADYRLSVAYEFPPPEFRSPAEQAVVCAQAPTIHFQVQPLLDKTEWEALKLYQNIESGAYDDEFGRLDAIDDFVEEYPHSMFLPRVRLQKFNELLSRKRYDEAIAEGQELLDRNLFAPPSWRYLHVRFGIIMAFCAKGDKDRATQEARKLPPPYDRYAASVYNLTLDKETADKSAEPAQSVSGARPLNAKAGSAEELKQASAGNQSGTNETSTIRETTAMENSTQQSEAASSLRPHGSHIPTQTSSSEAAGTQWGYLVGTFFLGIALGLAFAVHRKRRNV